MELLLGVEDLLPRHRPCVATIGNYDGVHLGHQSVLSDLLAKGEEHGVPTTVITFEPLAREYFSQEGIGGRLSTVQERAAMLGQLGIDQVLCLTFDKSLAEQPAEEFVREVLVEGLGIRHLVVGDDFRYGRDRAGDFSTLEKAGRNYGFELQATRSFVLGDVRVSSGRIREALSGGNCEKARRMLGRPYSISGTVAHGDELGRTIGFPTANIPLSNRDVPVQGVFAVAVVVDGEIVDGARRLNGVANVGTRPTVDGDEMRLEVHLLDFERDIYGRHLDVEFLARLRGEMKFSGLDALKDQIHRDIEKQKIISG